MTRTALGARQKVGGLFARRVHLQRWLDRVDPPEGSVTAIFGRPLGIPKTGVFGLYDLIGIDLMSDVASSLVGYSLRRKC